MRSPRVLPLALALVVAASTAAAQTAIPPRGTAAVKPAARPAPAANRITYVPVSSADYSFSTPAQVNAGIVAFNLMNNGADLHAMAVLELPADHTLREFLDSYHSRGLIPSWMPSLGQTAPIAPKQETFLTVRMKPGRYILACLIPARDGRAHTEKGMVTMITVR